MIRHEIFDRVKNLIQPQSKAPAEKIANILLAEFITRHSVSLRLMTDQGREYQNRLMKLLADSIFVFAIDLGAVPSAHIYVTLLLILR